MATRYKSMAATAYAVASGAAATWSWTNPRNKADLKIRRVFKAMGAAAVAPLHFPTMSVLGDLTYHESPPCQVDHDEATTCP
jgi:hypothetical protein